MTEQELLEELERSIESNNRNNLDLIKVLNGTDTEDVTLQDGSVVPSLSKRIQAEVVEDSNYLFKSDNLASVENKQTARTNLGVPSVTEMNTAITNATPNATETVAGKAKIATTVIAQGGVNDTDIMTALKTLLLFNLKSLGVEQTWQNVATSRASDTTYTNTTGKPIQIYIQGNVNGGLLSVGGSASISTHGNGMSLFIVPVGATYRFSGGWASWWELR